MKESPEGKLPLYTVRKQAVVLDSDLASVYGVETRSFNQAFKRNQKRFHVDFAFQLTSQEFRNLISRFVTSNGSSGKTLIY